MKSDGQPDDREYVYTSDIKPELPVAWHLLRSRADRRADRSIDTMYWLIWQ